jgi:hypothetical protein
MQNSKFGVLAVSVASSIMEEASEKAFDENSFKNFVDKKDKLTKEKDFGTES